MRKWLIVVAVMSLALCSAAWANVHLQESDLLQPTAVQVGSSLIISLPENPSTGYQWSLQWQPSKLLQLRGDEYQAPAGNVPGAGGTHHYTLRAVRTGFGAVVLQYGRRWHGGDKQPPVYLPIVVQPAPHEQGEPAPVQVDQAALQPLVDLPMSQLLSVALAENPSTGFMWSATWDPQEDLTLSSTDHTPGDQIGAPGVVRMYFGPQQVGQCLLVFQDLRSNGESAKVGCVLVQVSP
jgi:inhibitor of cysteine peptidase